jgi:serine/threonine-protein kinase
MVRSAALVFGALFLALVGAGGAIQAAAGRFSPDHGEYGAQGLAPLLPRDAGYLKFVVEPWAEVYVDGELVATTPTAASIALSPGRHYIKYKNPYFHEKKQEVVVKPGETETLKVELARRDAENAPAPETAQR